MQRNTDFLYFTPRPFELFTNFFPCLNIHKYLLFFFGLTAVSWKFILYNIKHPYEHFMLPGIFKWTSTSLINYYINVENNNFIPANFMWFAMEYFCCSLIYSLASWQLMMDFFSFFFLLFCVQFIYGIFTFHNKL